MPESAAVESALSRFLNSGSAPADEDTSFAAPAPAPAPIPVVAPDEPIAQAPPRSPYLSAERPRPLHAPYEAPVVATSAQESWGPDRRATPPATDAIPQVVPAQAPEEIAPPAPPVTYAPWTGAIPRVELPAATAAPEPAPATTEIPAPEARQEPTPEPEIERASIAETVVEPDFAPKTTPEFAAEPDFAPVAEPVADYAPVAQPSSFSPTLVNGLVPMPIEAEEAEIIAPVQPPAATEIQPQASDESAAYAPSWEREPEAQSEETSASQEYAPEASDPVKQLGASALSTASLEAAGAPTPRAGIPVVGGEDRQMPSFGEEEPFVPRFEPLGGVVPAPVPTVSFTTPHAAPRPFSPLDDLAIPESDEPAYVPKVELDDTSLSFMDGEHVPAAAPAPDSFTQPARPWATVDPSDVEFATGEPLGPETGTFEAESAPAVPQRVDEPAAEAHSPWLPIEGPGPSELTQAELTQAEPANSEAGAPEPTRVSSLFSEFAEPFNQDAPVAEESHPVGDPSLAAPATASTAAAFFAATSARDARASDEAPGTGAFETPLSGAIPVLERDIEPQGAEPMTDPATEPLAATETETETETETAAQPIHRDSKRTEPLHTTATAYTPSQGDWGPSTVSTSEAAALADHDADLSDLTDLTEDAALPGTTEGEAPIEPPSKAPHGRRRLVLWIVIAALAAAAIGAIAFVVFQPEPATLPTPTETASAPAPTAEPVSITDPTDFVAAMPSTVGTNVLVAYEVTNPAGDAALPARAAEHVTLTYGPGSTSTMFTIEAYQHYSVEDAQTAYDSYADGATDVEDVTVDGTTVGERAYSTTGATGTVVWRNETAVLVLTGPSAELLDFFAHFGV